MHPIQNLVGGELVRALLIQVIMLNLLLSVDLVYHVTMSCILSADSEAKAGY